MPTAGHSGLGSLPGDDIDAALGFAVAESPDLVWLPELPARGPGSDLVGRTLAAVAAATGAFGFDRQPSGWRLTSRPGLESARAADRLTADIDALLPFADLDTALKTQLAGPWTLAAAVELPRGGRALSDRGATRDLADALAETATHHLAAIAARTPRAALVLQLDEPLLPAVAEGALPTESGLGRLAAVAVADAAAAVDRVVGAAAADGAPTVLHCCATPPPLALLAATSAAAISIDATSLLAGERLDEDTLGTLVERGAQLWLGVLPSLGPAVPPTAGAVADAVRRLWRGLGFDPDELPGRVVLTTSCGLAGASTGWAHSSMRLLRQAAGGLSEAPERLPR
jgi:methionine synthase II (cobalamin-independent)